jgi:hypothetical protein
MKLGTARLGAVKLKMMMADNSHGAQRRWRDEVQKV